MFKKMINNSSNMLYDVNLSKQLFNLVMFYFLLMIKEVDQDILSVYIG